jgi:hypothetical protein
MEEKTIKKESTITCLFPDVAEVLLANGWGHPPPAFERLTGAQIVNRAPVRVGLCQKSFSSGTP